MPLPKGGKPSKIVYPPNCKEVSEDIGKDELVRRLKMLARVFQDMGQDENEKYSELALHLATEFFFDHASKDVRLLVACCIADVFRIFAPEAPYRDPDHLKEIFMFLVKQLRGLEDPESPSFKRYFYLLENLAWVKSFNICIELEDSQEIFCNLYKLMFSIINEKHSAKVRTFMLDMMVPLITEADTVSQELLDTILINLIEPYKSQNKLAYNLAKDLLRKTSCAVEPYIQTFFNNLLMIGKTSESEVSDHLYELIYELNMISGTMLLAVLPQLEFKLKSSEEIERKNVTRLLAKMFSDPESELATQHRVLWNCFLGRFNDISTGVRTVCVQYAQRFILHHSDLVKDIIEQLKIRQHDPEETVRMEVVSAVLNAAKKDFKMITDELLAFIKERTLDKKFKIRREALLGLAHLYKTYINQDPDNTAIAKRLAWVKDKVFHAYYQHSPEDRLLVERIFNTCLVPYTLPTSERMKRLHNLYTSLDEHALKAFNELLKYQHGVRVCVLQWIDALEQNLQGCPAPVVAKLIALARQLPEPNKAQEHLKKFNHILREDKRVRHCLKALVSSDCTCRKAEDAVKEILRKVGNPGQQTPFYTAVKSLLERIAPVMIDADAISALVKYNCDVISGLIYVDDGVLAAGEKGLKLLLALSSVFPPCFNRESVFEDLLTFLKNEDEVISDLTLQIFVNTGSNLKKDCPNIYSSLLPVLQTTAKMGNIRQTKHAIKCISIVYKHEKESILQQVFEHVKKSLNPESANFLTSIVSMGHIAQICPGEFSTEMKNVVSKLIVKDLLMQDRTQGVHVHDSWYADHAISEETQAKVLAMKMLVRWLLGLRNNAGNSATSTLRLLYTVIIHEGDLMERGKINKPELARLRLQAGCCMLKLAEEPCFAELITREQFQALALLINDSCYQVRLRFAMKLNKGLLSLRLPLEYMSIFSLAANDPVKERRAQVKQFLYANISKRREYLKQHATAGSKIFSLLPDYMLPYTIHLLAHDPDLKSHDHMQALNIIKECLWFVMDPLMSRSEDYNYAFFRRMIEDIKQTKDAQGPEDDEMNKKLYAVCDIALGLMMTKVSNVVLKDTVMEPVLPIKLFTKPDHSYSNTKLYLPKDFIFDTGKKKVAPTTLMNTSEKAVTAKPSVPFTTTEIIVTSPKPVVNPNPTCPRESKKKKEKENEAKESTSSQSDKKMKSEESTSEQKARTSRAVRQTSAAVKKKGALVKKATLQAGKKNKTPIKLTKAVAKSKKATGMQAKITDFRSPKRQTSKNSPLKVLSPTKQILNGSTKGTTRRAAQNRSSSAPTNNKAESSTRKRTAGSPDENIPAKKRAANEKESRKKPSSSVSNGSEKEETSAESTSSIQSASKEKEVEEAEINVRRRTRPRKK
ncbi:sister chromatid cohesion protein PDS5 homolog B isoform X1 [Octopus sinensis]|uniref:Sister chromatid cohesion protein PDS5 homolog B isoform X1 n=1 Tax=Octopus sinensis TaxID=2607531 RepID=A0A6P7T0F2_9MOLL|nr:sister chromatid cohesion protein PDS5 homolog B isoform X1 [Octopus sinensis]XP_029643843.1 sister chromatid cohesion protein PDS5 homolog B isoform X1 [Octopus sinensis]